MWHVLRILSVVAALSVIGEVASTVAPELHVEDRQKPGEFTAARESIAFSLFGQIRMSAGDLMWLKTLEYLHNGIIYRMPSEMEQQHGVTGQEFAGMCTGVAHVDGPSLVPDKARDWRGVLGTVDRHVEPWRPGHPQHSDPQELIPWYQMLVRFNPHYVQAYTNGAFFMADFAGEPEMARSFLVAGTEANPWSFEIEASLGRLLFEQFRDYVQAAEALQHATDLAAEEKAWYQSHGDRFDELQEQVLGETYLFLARSYESLGDYTRAADVADAGLKELPYCTLLRVEKRIALRKRDNPTAR